MTFQVKYCKDSKLQDAPFTAHSLLYEGTAIYHSASSFCTRFVWINVSHIVFLDLICPPPFYSKPHQRPGPEKCLLYHTYISFFCICPNIFVFANTCIYLVFILSNSSTPNRPAGFSSSIMRSRNPGN